jgi:zinc protease
LVRPDPDLLGGILRRELPNGLRILVKEDHRQPTVTVVLAYSVGSVHEPGATTGISHFLEHMVFRGTAKYGRGEIDRVTLRCGGENNAFTTHDTTGFSFHVSSDRLAEVLDILSDTMGNCTLDPKEVELERGPILQEMNLALDTPWEELERTLYLSLYPICGYRHPVLGWREHVERLTREQLWSYYRAHYTPNRATLVIVGDIAPQEALRKVEGFFGSIPRGCEGPSLPPIDPLQQSSRSVEVDTRFPNDRAIVAFRSCAAGTDEDVALDVIAAILGGGRLSRLKRRLISEEGLATEGGVQVTNDSRRFEGTFTIQVVVAEDASREKVPEVVGQELRALSREPVGEEELRRAQRMIRARFTFDLESQNDLAWKIGTYEALQQPDYLQTYLRKVEAMDPLQIMRVAERVFLKTRQVVVTGAGSNHRSWLGGRAPGAMPEGLWRGSARGSTAFADGTRGTLEARDVTLANGMVLRVRRRTGLPILALRARFDGGLLFEPEEKAGLAELAASMLWEGTDDGGTLKRSGEEIAQQLEEVGGEYASSGTGVSIKLLSEHADLGLDLLRDVLRFPSFPQDRMEEIREDQLNRIDSEGQDPADVAQRLFFENAFQGHPLHRSPLGSKETVRQITRADLLAYRRNILRPENIILAVVGDIDPDRAIKELRRRFEDWTAADPVDPLPAAPALGPGTARTVVHTYRSRQLRLHLGHVGIARNNPDYHALRIMETILGSSPGFTNRLASRLRDDLGLAYDVSGTITAGAGLMEGSFQITLGVEAKDKDRALAAVLGVVRTFLEEGPGEDEVEDAKAYLLGSFLSARETAEGEAEYLVLAQRFGLGNDYPAVFRTAISAVTREEISRVARKYVHPERFTQVLVGALDPAGALIGGDLESWSLSCRRCNGGVGSEDSTCPHCSAPIDSAAVVRRVSGVLPILANVFLAPRAFLLAAALGIAARALHRMTRRRSPRQGRKVDVPRERRVVSRL